MSSTAADVGGPSPTAATPWLTPRDHYDVNAGLGNLVEIARKQGKQCLRKS